MRTWIAVSLASCLLFACGGGRPPAGQVPTRTGSPANAGTGASSAAPSQTGGGSCQAPTQTASNDGARRAVLAPLSADRVAVAYNGVVEVNTDANWKTLFSSGNPQGYVRDLQWLGGQNLLVASTDGLFRADVDAGCSRRVGARTDLRHIHFLDLNAGWAAAGTDQLGPPRAASPLLRTTDGGSSWEPVETGLKTVDWVQFIDSQVGFVAGTEGVVSTTDGGRSWSHGLLLESGKMQESTGQVAFKDRLHGFAYYTGGHAMNQEAADLWYTADGGHAWTLESCSCGYVPSAYGTDKGAKASLPGGANSELSLTGPESGSIATWGPAGPRGGQTKYCASSNAGRDWTCRDIPDAFEALFSLAHWGPQVAWLVSGQSLLQSQDGGASWHKLRDLP